MKQFLLVFVLTICSGVSAWAQGITVSGTVQDLAGDPLAGASILEKGTYNGTVASGSGQFSLTVSNANGTLVVSFIGFTAQEIPLNGRKTVEIKLEEGNLLSQVQIVGSRSLNRSATDTPAPIDIINVREVTAKTGQLDLNQLLQYVAPSFNSNRQTGSDGADHVDPASLRGLGPDQTLVLINGKRRHQSSLVNLFGSRGRGNTGTDLNTIPAAAIERIEILRDGAAAQYGSDAIAGVINIVLKSSTGELTANANVGAYQAKYRFDDKKLDGLNTNINVNYGVKIAKDGFVNLTVDHNYRDHTNRANTNPGDLARRQYGDARMQNTSVYLNSRLPISSKAYAYVFGGTNFRKGDAYAWTRFADDDRNVPSIYPDGFDPIIASTITDASVGVGIRGDWKGWDVDLSNTFGSNRFHYGVNNTLNSSLGGTSPTKFDAGGFQLQQNTANLGFSRLFKSALQGVNVAFGAEYRNENYQIFAGEEQSWKSYKAGVPPGSQGFPGFQPSDEINKGRSNVGVYLDTEADFTRAFMVGAAVRFEDYSDFGSTLNGKLSSRLKINNFLTLRGTASTGFRAPSLPQRYFNSTITNFVGGKPVEVLIARNESAVTQALGIPPLKQETSQNLSLGLTARPASNLSVTVDAYLVKVKDRIVLTGQFSDDDDKIGAELQRLNVGKAQFFTNAVNTTTQGIDIIVAHRATMGDGALNTTLAANFNKLTIDEINTNAKLAGKEDIYFDLREQYFLRASAPPSKLNLTFDYSVNKLSVLLRFVRFGEIKLADWNYDENNLDIYKARTTTDLALSYQVAKAVRITVGGSNILNVYPTQFAPSLTESGGAWDPVQMGNNGAFWFLKTNFRF